MKTTSFKEDMDEVIKAITDLDKFFKKTMTLFDNEPTAFLINTKN